jgi:alpha-tubulin suppressor-like RCC1 family protein
VYAWGRNVFGQLGDGTAAERPGPKLLSSLSGITKVAAGDFFSMALGTNGTAYTFGNNSKLALGISGVNSSSTPMSLSGYGTIVDIAACANHGLLVNATSQLYAWGSDSNGQLGRGTTTGTNQLPQLVSGLSGVTITKVAAAENHSLALDSTGQVWVFGNDTYGQQGRGTTASSRPAPAMLGGISGATAITTSAKHSLILRSDWTVLAMGDNSSGQLGDGTTTAKWTPMVIPGLSNVVAIAAGDSHSMVLKSDGTVWTFGSRTNGQLCDGKTQGNALTPAQVMGL